MNAETELLAVRAAELYYEDGKTQDEIGAILHLTRWKVGRLLTQAKEAGFIRIEIVHPRARRLPLERELRNRFGLQDAVVVPRAGAESEAELRTRVAAGAAEYLTQLRPVPRTLGISWGRTMHDVAQALGEGWANGVNVVQINGGVSLNRRASTAANTAVTIAQKAGGSATLLPSPAILEEAETRRAIERDRTVAGVLELGRSANAYVFTAGTVDPRSVLVESGYLSAEEAGELVRKGAVADVLGRFIDADGNIIDPALDERTLGLGIEDIRGAGTAIAVISGESKHDICRVVVASGLCTVLVTDDDTAQHLLEGAA
ncbi:sugar-binding transcriptional regulator [Homoserinibacter sp. YIM 151385]|uniref:sugar-binding transcriptional regulator n=1 Tax=Homoserinibacter sp. YIM 151385 TaxID=2985506 RepID=UPI0022F0C177|nr:sugar-binding transcriptional regulator [Homoserinibacter sp. YIM 151385]WBU39261.1 sugar-binding transcriptional regulator [Homoserinibacter sp. YIM 151385]